jgi:hypothetical protein
VLTTGPAAGTTEVEDVDGEPPRGCYREVCQRPPPKLKTSIPSPCGVLAAGPAAVTTKVEDIDGGPPGAPVRFSTAATTKVEDVDGGPPRGCWR